MPWLEKRESAALVPLPKKVFWGQSRVFQAMPEEQWEVSGWLRVHQKRTVGPSTKGITTGGRSLHRSVPSALLGQSNPESWAEREIVVWATRKLLITRNLGKRPVWDPYQSEH